MVVWILLGFPMYSGLDGEFELYGSEYRSSKGYGSCTCAVSESPGAIIGAFAKASKKSNENSGPVAHPIDIADRKQIAIIEYERKRFNR
jgi:hypothetical protein